MAENYIQRPFFNQITRHPSPSFLEGFFVFILARRMVWAAAASGFHLNSNTQIRFHRTPLTPHYEVQRTGGSDEMENVMGVCWTIDSIFFLMT